MQTEKDTQGKEAEGGSSVGQYCSDTFSFPSLNVDISRFLAISILKCSLWHYAFFQLLFPLLSRRTLQSLLNTPLLDGH